MELQPRFLAQRAEAAMRFHFTDVRSLAFQTYYVRVTNDRAGFLQRPNFFQEFKSQYALQGIDSAQLLQLEASKPRMLRCVVRDHLVPLYRQYFADAVLTHAGLQVHKNLNSFFTKFVHTFRPEEYCALDNPIKELLGLKRENFVSSFLAISAAYQVWIQRHPHALDTLRSAVPPSAHGYSAQMTDVKLLDLYFWHRANKAGAP